MFIKFDNLDEISGAPFKKFASLRDEWALKNRYISPGKSNIYQAVAFNWLAYMIAVLLHQVLCKTCTPRLSIVF